MRGLRLHTVSNRLELHISDDFDDALFTKIGELLQQSFGGSWLEKIDGLDQRYWDLKIESSVLTLHLEHYFGIMLFPSSECEDISSANSLIEKAHRLLASSEHTA